MNPEIIFTNQTKVRALSASLVFKTIRRALALSGLGSQRVSLSVSLVSRAKMRQLNRQWRAVDKPTDVLSFPQQALKPGQIRLFQKGDIIQSELSSVDLGDIFLCPAVVRAEATLFALTEKQLSIRLLIHGLLHLLGFDHQTPALTRQMERQEKKLINSL